ncbi:MAG: hypothetical protein K0Q50_80 [Vampirovibrio sp.]|jgi:hypothetical protein|nr:hypothetical protein [Vampirovibrio sp.]
MTGRESSDPSITEPFQGANPPEADLGRPSREEEEREENKNIEDYMSNLGAGTGVDIGPGAAGEMGGAAREPDQAPPNKKETSEASVEYPDSGDLPQINR